MPNLLSAAEALIARLEEMEQPLNDLAAFRAIHGIPYTGPNWGEPLAALRLAVADAKREGPGDGEILDIWRSIQPTDLMNGDMWSLSIEQIDIYTWSVYAIRMGDFSGRVESNSILKAVSQLAQDIRDGHWVTRAAMATEGRKSDA